jgi:hypothetical protein
MCWAFLFAKEHMTAESLAAIAGVILSLAFSYVPGLSDKFSQLDATVKRLLMAALLLIVAVGALALSCANVVVSVECSKEGLIGLVNVFIAALVANQATYTISPQKSSKAAA